MSYRDWWNKRRSPVTAVTLRVALCVGLSCGALCSVTTVAFAQETISLDADTLANAEASLGKSAKSEKMAPKATTKAAPKAEVPAAAARLKTPSGAASSSKDRKIAELSRRLSQARNDLMVAEMEVERLSRVIEERNQLSLGGKKLPRASTGRSSQRTATKSRAEEPSRSVPKASSDMEIATVIVDKANLRTGPGKSNSPLMTVAKGTRLAIEHRSGEWYRVIAPTGMRAWVSGEVVSFGKTRRSSPTRTLRIGGVQESNDEERAFELIKRGSR